MVIHKSLWMQNCSGDEARQDVCSIREKASNAAAFLPPADHTSNPTQQDKASVIQSTITIDQLGARCIHGFQIPSAKNLQNAT